MVIIRISPLTSPSFDNIYVRFHRVLSDKRGSVVDRQLVFRWRPVILNRWVIYLSVYSNGTEFLDRLLKDGRTKHARKSNLSCLSHVDDLISFNMITKIYEFYFGYIPYLHIASCINLLCHRD